jgi:membrane associated rhomboid family serine protease
MHIDSLGKPWMWWQMLTAGFAHDPTDFFHIGGNMLMLFFFGREIEQRYGSKEFLRIYLITIVFSSLCWALYAQWIQHAPPFSACYGASGAVSGILILFALNFPRRQILLFFMIPIPAWIAGILWIAFDLFGATMGGNNVAHSAHLAGMLLALLYYRFNWNFGRWIPNRFMTLGDWLRNLTPTPQLRIHDPDSRNKKLVEEADRILEKLHQKGESSLTSAERKILKNYSKRMRQKHR